MGLLSLDPLGAVITILFVIGCLLIVPINNELDRRRRERRRFQAHERRKAGRW